MGLFKSKQQRQIERDIEIRKGIAKIKRQIGELGKHEKQWLVKAQRARQMGSNQELAFLRKTLKNTIGQRRLLERQMLMMESAYQMKNQMETYQQFATSMGALSKSIAEVFQNTDLASTQQEFESAIAKAESMEQMMEIFISMSSSSMADASIGEEAIEDREIDALLDEAIGASEGEGLDPEIEAGLKQIEEELRGG
ncbi:MAG: hypothetical protein AB7K09_10670 [Planctomycetota bacterium]